MRACFLGRNICALGYGIATLQTTPLEPPTDEARQPDRAKSDPRPPYPMVLPADGHKYGRASFHRPARPPLSSPL